MVVSEELAVVEGGHHIHEFLSGCYGDFFHGEDLPSGALTQHYTIGLWDVSLDGKTLLKFLEGRCPGSRCLVLAHNF